MAQCLSGLLSRHTDTNYWPHGYTGTHTQYSKQTYVDSNSYVLSLWNNYTKLNCVKMYVFIFIYTHTHKSITFAYSELFSRTVSCWVRQHTLAGVSAAGVLANSEGTTTGTSTWLGANTWRPVMVNKISVEPQKTMSGHVEACIGARVWAGSRVT